MKRSDIKPGEFYRDRDGDLMRVKRIGEPRYSGDTAIVVGEKARVRGMIETRHAPRDIKEPATPSEAVLRVWRAVSGFTQEEE